MGNQSKELDYKQLTLIQLCHRIVHDSDEKALKEMLNNRNVFYISENNYGNYWGFVNYLRKNLSLKDETIAEKTTDFLIERFVNFPIQDHSEKNKKKRGPDCRYQYKAYLEKFAGLEFKSINEFNLTQIHEQELEFQRLVYRHFKWCLKETQRIIQGWNRYNWTANRITVYLPLRLKSNKRKLWLEENVGAVGENKHAEKKRVQAEIDNYFGFYRWNISFEDSGQELENDDFIDPLSSDEMNYKITTKQLRVLIADEKVKEFKNLRPCIQKLEKEKLHQLIVRIFDDIEHTCYHPSQLAMEYGIGASCMSNFAGTKWIEKIEQPLPDKNKISDLFRNTAHFLSSEILFVEAAQEAGVWERVKMLL